MHNSSIIMSYSLKVAILAVFLVSSCIPANDVESSEIDATTEPIASPTVLPTGTYAVKYPYMVETPFWESYQPSTPVPTVVGSPVTTRKDYLEMSVDEGVASGWWMLPFKTDFENAVKENLVWIHYPQQIALRISGYPNPDYPDPEEVKLYGVSDSSVIAIVTDRKLLDDSVSAYEYRIEMAKLNNYWKVKWLGLRWRCHRGHQEWDITPCI
jgi:hypothetical protein